MLSLPDVMHLFPDEFARLSRRCFAFLFVFSGPFHGFFFWHDVPPLVVR
jgi:hypothetical protein